ncbi:MAG: formate/nitrite transporter family protein [Clostridia bacterium]|nr:formate/nitrite transporter family protein [Clostridia bacterium]
MRQALLKIAKGIAAGIMISIGCAVYLACENKTVGAIGFSVALLIICYLKFSLYTGKIGFLIVRRDKEYFSELTLGLLGNAIGVIICGWLLSYAFPQMRSSAISLYDAKLSQTFLQTIIRAAFCGVLMYVAVAVFSDKNSPIGILFAIPVFILSGFEHSIADMGYFAISMQFSLNAFGYIWTVILGNSIGSLIISFLAGSKEKNNGLL